MAHGTLHGVSLATLLTDAVSATNERIEGRIALLAIRRGLINMIPLLLPGSIALVFLSLPVPGYQALMGRLFGERWQDLFTFVRDGTYGIFAIVMVLCISHSYAEERKKRGNAVANPLIAAIVSLASFVAISGMSRPGFTLARFGVLGVFTAMIVAITSSALFMKLLSWRFLGGSIFAFGDDLSLSYTVRAIMPGAVTVTLFAGINRLLAALFGISDIQAFIAGPVNSLFRGLAPSFASGFLFVLLTHVLWFFGIHGADVLEPVAQGIFVPALTRNQLALAAGRAPSAIFTKTFFDTFVLMGGCGTALCLVIAILLVTKDRNQRRLATLSLFPVVFNINELILFGVPVVLNPAFIIPFLVTPLLVTLTSSLAVLYHVVPYTCHAVEWTTPVFLSGFMATGSVRGCLLQALNIGLGILCYLPFVRLASRIAVRRTEREMETIYAIIRDDEKRGERSTLLTRGDEAGSIARFLAADLERDVQEGNIILHYQPQVDFSGKLIGIESLLRWFHGGSGSVYPPLVVALSQEAGFVDRLGERIIDTALRDLAILRDRGARDLVTAVNVTAVQLENGRFVDKVRTALDRYGIPPANLEIEITEQLAMSSGERAVSQIRALKELGVKLAMDDFGMGHSSLMYLKDYRFDTVKLDGSLVRDIPFNATCRNIISTIVGLGKSLNYAVLAEFVESEEQRLALHALGCDRYQGYLYSPALPFDELARYLERRAETEELVVG